VLIHRGFRLNIINYTNEYFYYVKFVRVW
jgi:hypothetical protein